MIERRLVVTDIIVSDTPSESSRISLDCAAGAILICPPDCEEGTVSFFLAAKEEGPYVPLHGHSASGALGIDVEASIAKELPPAVFSAAHMKIVSSVEQPTTFFQLLQKS